MTGSIRNAALLTFVLLIGAVHDRSVYRLDCGPLLEPRRTA